MATSDQEFFEASKLTPESYQPSRERGCFFYGCIIAIVMALLFVLAVGVGFYMLYRALGRAVEQYTATAPRELPKVEMPPERRQSLKERYDAFRKALDEGTATDPLVLTGDDVNALIEEEPDWKFWKGKLYVTIEGDKVKSQVSIPLENLSAALEKVGIGLLRGRYLNGEAELKASLRDGLLLITLESIEVNGQRPPEEFLANLRQQNLAEDAYKDQKKAEQIRKLESIEIKDGKIIIKPRPKDKKAGASAPLEDLPEDVLAPPDSTPPKAAPK
jgi:hypothetical protein